MADNVQKISGVSGNSFSIGIKANKATFATNGTNVSLDKVLDMSTHKIISVVNPSNPQDAMTLNYADSNYINLTQKASANGVATLDAAGKIPVSQLPNSIMEYKGAWDAATNLPVLADAGTATKAYKTIQDITYTAKVAGSAGNSITIAYVNGEVTPIAVATKLGNAISVSIQSGATTASTIKTAVDGIVGTTVDVVVNSDVAQTAPVSATNLVYGQDTANAGDVLRVSVEGTQNLGSGAIKFYVGDFVMYSGTIWERSPMADGVVSVFGRFGAVVSANGDYTASQVTNVPIAAVKSSKTIQDLIYTAKVAGLAGNSITIAYVNGEVTPIAVATKLGNAISVSIKSGATTASTIKTAVDGIGGITVDVALVGTGAETETAPVAPTNLENGRNAGTTSGITVQAAIDELTDEKMMLVSTPTLNHVLVTDAYGQAVDSAVALSTLTGKMNLIASPTNNHLVTTDGSGQAVDSGKVFTGAVNVSSTSSQVPTANAVWTAISTNVATGTVQTIRIPVAVINMASTFALANGSIIKSVSLIVSSAYSAGGTIAASVGAVNILATTDNDAQTPAQYSNSDIVDIATGAVVTVTVGGSPALGASVLVVDFVTSPIV